MGLKFGGVRYRLTGDAEGPRRRSSHARPARPVPRPGHGHLHLRRAPGRPQPVAGDRALHGGRGDVFARAARRDPGDARLGDRLEKLAFNAFPATFKKDMRAHQYDQQANQVVCKVRPSGLHRQRARREPLRPGAELRLLHGQHAPGLAQVRHPPLDAVADGGLAAMAYAPCVVETRVDGKPVKVEMMTDYPFRDDDRILVTAARADERSRFDLRIPAWVEAARSSATGPASIPRASSTPGSFFHALAEWAGYDTRSRLDFTLIGPDSTRATTTPSPSSAARSSTR